MRTSPASDALAEMKARDGDGDGDRIALGLHRLGINSDLMHGLGFGSIVAAVSFWARSAAVDNKEARARAERLAIFVGLWPPTFFLLGKVLQDIEAAPEEQAQRGREAKGESLEDALTVAGTR